MRKYLLILLTPLISACAGPMVNIAEVDEEAISGISVFSDVEMLRNENIKVIGSVNATSCQHLLWEERSTEKNCINQLRMRANALGANGIVVGASEEGSANFLPSKGINRNCWNTVDCSGTAIIYDD